MAYVEGQLNGYQDYRVGLEINYSGVQSGNQSRFDWAVRIVGTYGSWTNATQYWSANIGGTTYSGTFTLPFGWGSPRILATGSTWHSHDALGYRSGFASSAYLDTNHTNIGDGGSGNAWVDAPRIAQVPAAPTSVGIDQETATSFRYQFAGNDNGGSGIIEWQVQYATNAGFTTGVGTITPAAANGLQTVSGLTPALTYWVRSRGRNAIGWGPYSSALSVSIGLPAPTFTGFTQNGSGHLVGTWTAPSPATGLTGYRLQVATNEGFTENVTFHDFGNVLTGAVTGKAGGRLYYARVAALSAGGVNAYSSSRNHTLVLDAGDLDGWTRVGTKPANISYYTTEGIRRGLAGSTQALYLESLATGAATLAIDTFGIQKTITGLTVGKAYRFEARGTLTGSTTVNHYSLLVVSETAGAGTDIATNTELGAVEFVADSTSVTLQIRLAEAVTIASAQSVVESVAFHGIKLLELDTDFPQRLRGTVYESNLANHFDLACNSVGATWYVDVNGVTQFQLPGTSLPVSARFSDETDPSAVSYVDIVAGFDTRSTVNRIEATNYGVGPDDNEENDSLIVEDTASQLIYGVYRSNLELNLYDESPYDDSFVERLDALLAAYAEPQPQVTQIRWNAQENWALLPQLEVSQRINVRYRGDDYDSQIVAIRHDVTPTRHMVTLDLQPL